MRARPPHTFDSGFVLVGVIVFVLALTILALSFYSLSGYESQFLQRSLDEEQAFQTAMSGIERAKFALCRTSRLGSVSDSMPAGVDTTVALQSGRTSGGMTWGPTDLVSLHVVATVNHVRRVVDASFFPVDSVAVNYYSSLVTVGDSLHVEIESPLSASISPKDRTCTVWLDGDVWESSGEAPSAWMTRLSAPPPSVRTAPAVPVPDTHPFLDSASPSSPLHGALPVAITEPSVNDLLCTLDTGASEEPVYFTSHHDPFGNFSFNSYPYAPHMWTTCTIWVSGLAVWLLPHGALFYEDTRIEGDPARTDNCLVVIADTIDTSGGGFGPSDAPHTNSGICFLGSVRAHVPVVLVSSGEVLFWHENDWSISSSVPELAVFSRSARFMGPYVVSSPHLYLHRDPAGPLGTLIQTLAHAGALPNAPRGGKHLALVPGSWRITDR